MEKFKTPHTFHIPVMGIGYTVDTPVKVAKYGISSVISLVDDMLLERMREFYSKKFNLPYKPILARDEDCRAQRITSYLNLVDDLVTQNFNELKQSIAEKKKDWDKYFDLLPNFSEAKLRFQEFINNHPVKKDIQAWLNKNLTLGSIDVNIMTKMDQENYQHGKKLPQEYNDAHAALRGFAESKLESSLVLSAGMNPRLYSYFENFNDFYPNQEGKLKKKIILKVSDFRSALIQGKFLAKKGIWISEYRIESGLNCGGHAFATDGYLLGPILQEFKDKREMLIRSTHEVLVQALKQSGKFVPEQPMEVKFSAQGGVGSASEHQFLLEYYKLDSIGWGTPFLLVPEAVNVDPETIELLSKAKEEDLYLSDVSPLGVPFNNVRNNTKDLEKIDFVKKGRPGTTCPKQHAQFNKEFSERAICTASRQYQKQKIHELEAMELTPQEFDKAFAKIVEKSCICNGLGITPLLVNNLDTKVEGKAVSICPGPNIAYFKRSVSFKEMVDHIYGRTKIIQDQERPNLFVKELHIYIDYLKKKISELKEDQVSDKQIAYFITFRENLQVGIEYYKELMLQVKHHFDNIKEFISQDLKSLENELQKLNLDKFTSVSN
ncbi:MAG: hypothetical protein ACNS62_13000 [Candidatus Cyclobacteriaceae bacterium M3_2C_046]